MSTWIDLLRFRPVLAKHVVRQLGLRTPLPIQRSAIPRIIAGETVALHAQTGSGKTYAYLLPLLARLRLVEPRQALIIVPSKQLAMQTLSSAAPLVASGDVPSVELFRSADPSTAVHRLLEHNAPVLIMTGAQLEEQLRVTPHEECTTLDVLRRTVQTIVIDEPDSLLRIPSKPAFLNRARRDRWVLNQKVTYVLRQLLLPRRDARFKRVQLVVASATLTQRTYRDICTLTVRLAGKFGFVAAGSDPTHATQQLLASRSQAPKALPFPDEPAAPRDDNDAALDAPERLLRIAPAVVGPAGAPVGPAGRLLRVQMPPTITHHMWSCVPEDKSEAIAAVLREKPAKLALLVVRNRLSCDAALEEVSSCGVKRVVTLERLIEEAETIAARAATRTPAEARPATDPAPDASADAAEASETFGADGAEDGAPLSTPRSHLALAADKYKLIIANEKDVQGLDIPSLELVILTMIPDSVEDYMHIAGRTGRVGRRGHAVSIYTPRELRQAGVYTRSLGVRWRTRTYKSAETIREEEEMAPKPKKERRVWVHSRKKPSDYIDPLNRPSLSM